MVTFRIIAFTDVFESFSPYVDYCSFAFASFYRTDKTADPRYVLWRPAGGQWGWAGD